MPNQHLKRFGALLLDPEEVLAVGPIYYADGENVQGVRVVLRGGAIDVLDHDTTMLINQWFEEPKLT